MVCWLPQNIKDRSHREPNNHYSTCKIAGAVSGLVRIGWAVTATRNRDGKTDLFDIPLWVDMILSLFLLFRITKDFDCSSNVCITFPLKGITQANSLSISFLPFLLKTSKLRVWRRYFAGMMASFVVACFTGNLGMVVARRNHMPML